MTGMLDLRETVIAWQLGWGTSRSLPPAEPVAGGLRVECRQDVRDIEIFALDADDDPGSVARLAAMLGEEVAPAWLTVPTREPDRVAAVLQGAGLEFVTRTDALMTADLRARPPRPLDPPYTLRTEVAGPVVHVTVRAADGEQAARGYAALCGPDAIADRILTAEAHRRRSLGTAVMTALGNAAVTADAHRGLLIGGVEGQRLYRSLGWTVVADVLIAKLPG